MKEYHTPQELRRIRAAELQSQWAPHSENKDSDSKKKELDKG